MAKGSIVRFSDGSISTLGTMLESPHIKAPVGRILKSLPIGTEAHYNGIRSHVGRDMLLAYPEYGVCEQRWIQGVSFLSIDDRFPFALERANVPEEKAWYVAAIFAGLKEALAVRSAQPASSTSYVLEAAAQVEIGYAGLWAPSDPRTMAINRLSAGLALHHAAISPVEIDIADTPPYPNHIAAFLDPVCRP